MKQYGNPYRPTVVRLHHYRHHHVFIDRWQNATAHETEILAYSYTI